MTNVKCEIVACMQYMLLKKHVFQMIGSNEMSPGLVLGFMIWRLY